MTLRKFEQLHNRLKVFISGNTVVIANPTWRDSIAIEVCYQSTDKEILWFNASRRAPRRFGNFIRNRIHDSMSVIFEFVYGNEAIARACCKSPNHDKHDMKGNYRRRLFRYWLERFLISCRSRFEETPKAAMWKFPFKAFFNSSPRHIFKLHFIRKRFLIFYEVV